MHSRLFDSIAARLILGALFIGAFLNIYLFAGMGSGQIGDLVFIGVRRTWMLAQICGWVGLSVEGLSAILVGRAEWRRAAFAGWVFILLASVCFIYRSDDFLHLGAREVWSSLLVLLAATCVRLGQIRMKPVAKKAPTAARYASRGNAKESAAAPLETR